MIGVAVAYFVITLMVQVNMMISALCARTVVRCQKLTCVHRDDWLVLSCTLLICSVCRSHIKIQMQVAQLTSVTPSSHTPPVINAVFSSIRPGQGVPRHAGPLERW